MVRIVYQLDLSSCKVRGMELLAKVTANSELAVKMY